MSCCCEGGDPALSACCSLESTLAIGNTSGGTDIIMTSQAGNPALSSEIRFPINRTVPGATIRGIDGQGATGPAGIEVQGGDAPGLAANGFGGPAVVRGGNGAIEGGDVEIRGGNGDAQDGGAVTVEGGASTAAQGGNVHVLGGEGGTFAGGSIDVIAGSGDQAGGQLQLSAGSALLPGGVQGGALIMQAGSGGQFPGDVNLAAGSAETRGGNIIIEAGGGTGVAAPGGNLSLLAGLGDNQIGDVRIGSGAQEWTWPKEEGLAGGSLKTNGAGLLEFQPPMLATQWACIARANEAATLVLGVNSAGTGVITAKAVTAGNVYQRAIAIEMLSTTPALNNNASLQGNAACAVWGDGFDIWSIFGLADASAGNGLLAGLWAFLPIAANQPSNNVNFCAFGWDATDANIQLMHNDGAGLATKIPTTIAKPVVARGDLYLGRLFKRQNGTTVRWSLLRFSDLARSSGVTGATNLPAATLAYRPGVFGNNVGAATTAGVGIASYGGLVSLLG